jgi:hypothetical protein
VVRINRIVNIVAEHLDVLEIVRSQALLCSHIKVIVTIDEWRGGIEGLGIKANNLATEAGI